MTTPTAPAASENARAEDYIDTYANVFRMGTTAADFTLIFGSTNDLGMNNIRTLDRAAIHVSSQMLKILSMQLAANVDAFEKIFGKIPMPKAIEDGIRQNQKDAEKYFANLNT